MSEIDFSDFSNKKYYSISEVSALLGVKQTEIRYWEKFEPKLKSLNKSRSYNLKKIKLLIRIKQLVKDQGIKPSKIDLHLKVKSRPSHQNLNIKKELKKIKDLIKKASKL